MPVADYAPPEVLHVRRSGCAAFETVGLGTGTVLCCLVDQESFSNTRGGWGDRDVCFVFVEA